MKETRNLPCPLSPSELNEVGLRLAHKQAELKNVLARKKAMTSQLGGEQKVVEAEIERLAAMRRDEVEGRDVDVAIAKDHGRYVVTRLDNGIEVVNRPLRADEKQEPITFEEPLSIVGKKPKGKKGKVDAADEL